MSSSSSRPAPIRSFIVASTVRRSPRRSATAPTAAPATVSASPPTSDGRICSTPRAVSASSPEFRASEQRKQKSTIPKQSKLLDVSDLASYLGKKYGGWYPVCEQYLRPDGKKWLGVPWGAAGSMMNYRESMLKAVGVDKFPTDTDTFLKMMKALKEK